MMTAKELRNLAPPNAADHLKHELRLVAQLGGCFHLVSMDTFTNEHAFSPSTVTQELKQLGYDVAFEPITRSFVISW